MLAESKMRVRIRPDASEALAGTFTLLTGVVFPVATPLDLARMGVANGRSLATRSDCYTVLVSVVVDAMRLAGRSDAAQTWRNGLGKKRLQLIEIPKSCCEIVS